MTDSRTTSRSDSRSDSHSDLSYCRRLVRARGSDFYLSSLLYDSDTADSVIPLYAFHIELTNIVLGSTESSASAVRLHWWRDVLSGATGSGNHPVARELLSLADRHSFSPTLLLPKIEGHLDELLGCSLPTTSEFDELCISVRGCLFDVPVRITGYAPDDSLSVAVRHSSITSYILWVIMHLRYFVTHNRPVFPSDVLGSASITPDEFFGGDWTDRHRAATSFLLDYCASNLRRAESALLDLDSPLARRLFLPLSVSNLYIQKLRKNLDRPYVGCSPPLQLLRQWRMLRACRRRNRHRLQHPKKHPKKC